MTHVRLGLNMRLKFLTLVLYENATIRICLFCLVPRLPTTNWLRRPLQIPNRY